MLIPRIILVFIWGGGCTFTRIPYVNRFAVNLAGGPGTSREHYFDPRGINPYLPEAIVCEEGPPGDTQHFARLLYHRGVAILPNHIPIEAYENVTSFCASWEYGGLPESNMGGECSRESGMDNLEFHFELGDWRLFSNPVFRDICLQYCSCIGELEPGRRARPPIAQPSHDYADALLEQNMDQQELRGGTLPNVHYGVFGAAQDSRPDGRSCSGKRPCYGFKCSGIITSGCRCLAKQLQQGLFTVLGCGVLTAATKPRQHSRIGGRSLDAPSEELGVGCPCNGSYVSRGCCDSESGYIWEHHSMKLGELHPRLLSGEITDEGRET